MTGNGRYGYVSTVRQEGLGDKDIYKVTFNDSSTYLISSLISGSVSSASGPKPELRQVSLLDKDKKVVALYKPYFVSTHFSLPATPGVYTLKVEGYGYQPIEEEITVGDTPKDI